MAEEKNTTFNYLLNAMELAGQEKHPAKAGYAGKRKALMAHVRELERKAAAYDAMPKCKCGQPWVLNTVHRANSPCWLAQEPPGGLGPNPSGVPEVPRG